MFWCRYLFSLIQISGLVDIVIRYLRMFYFAAKLLTQSKLDFHISNSVMTQRKKKKL